MTVVNALKHVHIRHHTLHQSNVNKNPLNRRVVVLTPKHQRFKATMVITPISPVGPEKFAYDL